MESIYTELALYGSQNEGARTDNVFFPISEVCNSTVSLTPLQQNEDKIRSCKQKWFPAQYAATSYMPAQLLLANGCQNSGVYTVNTVHCKHLIFFKSTLWET